MNEHDSYDDYDPEELVRKRIVTLTDVGWLNV
jgi:hypothetical protein